MARRIATEEQCQAFGAALDAALHAQGMPRAMLGKLVAEALGGPTTVPFSTTTVGSWVNGSDEPGRDRVEAAERVLGLEPGELSRHLGYVPAGAAPVPGVLDAIRADRHLSDDDKVVLSDVYASMVKRRRPRAPRSSS